MADGRNCLVCGEVQFETDNGIELCTGVFETK